LSSHIKKVLIVTGSSRGIGAATAKLAASQGYAVCVNYLHNQQAADAVVADIRSAGGTAVAMQADLAVEAEIVALFQRVDQELGPVTALVNNAGILEQQSSLLDMDERRLQRVFATNVVGPMLCAREAVKRMSAKLGGKGGAIVNVSSAAARLGAAGEYIDYASSKGALDTFTIGLSKEVADQGIRVNSVRPGFIYTDIHASGGEPGRVDRVKDSIPMKRGGQPEEVAQAILWLLSEQASYATGTFIDLAGGR
jgi:NAD(P)-dependent dehydrogenase (short-subunit alcohol dehydrogenase family)